MCREGPCQRRMGFESAIKSNVENACVCLAEGDGRLFEPSAPRITGNRLTRGSGEPALKVVQRHTAVSGKIRDTMIDSQITLDNGAGPCDVW